MDDLDPLQKDLKQLDEKVKGIQQLQSDDELIGPIVRMQTSQLLHTKTQKQAELAQHRRAFIEGVHHSTKRAYKELPQFFKFRLFKNKPRRLLRQGKTGPFIEPIKEQVNFRGLKAEVAYYEGELGDTDRMVYLAVVNEAIRHREFVKEFGQIPFSMEELALKAGLGPSGRRQELVHEALFRLQNTAVEFQEKTGGILYTERFHLIENYSTAEKKKFSLEVAARLQTLPQTDPPEALQVYIQEVKTQAVELLAKFKPRTPKLTLVKFNEPLTRAILSNQVTTVDMWALQRLTRNSARTFYLYLYDLSQWRTSQEPVEIPLQDLMTLMDVAPSVEHKNDSVYPQWNRCVVLVKQIFKEVNQVAQCIEWYEWLGEGEETTLRVRLSDKVVQIPPK